MGAPLPQDGSTSATLPAGYPPQPQYPPPGSQYPPNSPQYPPPSYPQQYEPPHVQGVQQSSPYGQTQAYAQEPPGSKGQPAYAQQAVPAVGVPAAPAGVTYASTLRPQVFLLESTARLLSAACLPRCLQHAAEAFIKGHLKAEYSIDIAS